MMFGGRRAFAGKRGSTTAVRWFLPVSLAMLLTVWLAIEESSGKEKRTITLEDRMGSDPHSFARPNEVAVRHLQLDISISFDQQRISGQASLTIENKTGAEKIHLDTRNMTISKVTLDDQKTDVAFQLTEEIEKQEYLGRELVIPIRENTSTVHIQYQTEPDAAALQWLQPVQTAGGKKPYLYTQSQAILARSWVPCQDTPAVRMTYAARVRVPEGYLAIMSAENPKGPMQSGIYEFEMKQPIPSYLLALAVGDIAFRATGKITGVYSEPELVEQAAWEFAETEKMMEAVEKLYGKYRWGRYDLLVLPPSFPWGGMENPRLTFLGPSLLAGDRSLVATIAHELAHSWSGNLVTNATWNDFWLNEGFTSYLTHRIMHEVYGKQYGEMLDVLSFQDLQREVKQLGAGSPDTHLKLNLKGRDPEEGVTNIAYEKGQFFLMTIENHVGREAFDRFLKNYFDHFAFKSLTTEEFIPYLRDNLLKNDKNLEAKLMVQEWIYGPGIPSNVVKVHSSAFDRVEAQLQLWMNGAAPGQLSTSKWTTHEWVHFIRSLPLLSEERMNELDKAFNLTGNKNSEILNEWLLKGIQNLYRPAYPAIERFLSRTGRRKYVRALFLELSKSEEGLKFARSVYEKTRPSYHSTTRDAADRILNWKTS